MIRSIRRRLRTIAYYSARQERTVWMRITDVLLLLSPVLALLLALVMHTLSFRAPQAIAVTGYLSREPSGQWDVRIEGGASGQTQTPSWMPTPIPTSAPVPTQAAAQAPAEGDFEITTRLRACGWPFASGLTIDPPTITLRALRGTDGGQADAELKAAIDQALRASNYAEVADALAADESRSSLRPAAFLGNLITWWVVLFFLLPLLLLVVRLIAWVGGEAHRARRRRLVLQGRCPNCGFDVRGSVWSSNCPECGSLLG